MHTRNTAAAIGWTARQLLLRSRSALFVFALVASGLLEADALRPEGRYDATVAVPSATLGFEVGERAARHEAILRYAEALAKSTPRARLVRYGRTHEGRELVFLAISEERNIARLSDLQNAVKDLADPRRAVPDELFATTPAIVFMACSVHGDEFSGADAGLRLTYELAAGEGEDVRAIRKELVVLIDPAQNPDGRERILSMNASYEGALANPDPDSLSHTGFWPWGRANHYLFDLNRDWFALVHPESRGRAAVLAAYRPQLVVDSHEMGGESTYLFSPPRAPFNPNLPKSARGWWEKFAADQAVAFDRHGFSYYTREWNEEFYPGYGSGLPLYQGAVGILYEQAGTDGQAIRRPYGAVMTYREAVLRHFTSMLANLQTAAANRVDLLKAYRAARAEAVDRGRKGPALAYYILPNPDPARADRLASNLALLGIEVERLGRPGTLAAARNLWEDAARNETLPIGTYRVRLDQPDGLLARAILEPHTPMSDSFLAEEREHLERQKGTRLYDVTGWSPLLASGLVCLWTKALDGLSWEPLPPPRPDAKEIVTRIDKPAVSESGAAYGLLFDGATDAAITLAHRLATEGVKVRVGDRLVIVRGRPFSRGSFLIRRDENSADAFQTALVRSAELGVAVFPSPTGRAEKGPDLGADTWALLQESRIGILAGAPLDVTSVGAAWNLLDRERGLRTSLLDVSRLERTSLTRYNVLVMPTGPADGYRRALNEGALKALRTWVEAGGTLVAMGGASEFAAADATKLVKTRLRGEMLKDFPAPRFGLDEEAIASMERLQATGLRADGKSQGWAGLLSEESWPAALGIPGPGSPILGPGTWELLGPLGETARKRVLKPAKFADVPSTEGPAPPTPTPVAKGAVPAAAPEKPAAPPRSDSEQEVLRKKHDDRLRRFSPSGTILRVDLDPEHFLAYGAGERVAAMVRAKESLLARDPVQTVGRFAEPDRLHLGGLLWPEAAGRLARTAYVTREAVGRGQVILFADDPNFRGYFWGTSRLFLNAVLLGPGLGTEQTVPW